MQALFYKQWKLTAHPMTLVFILSGAMLLIPNYPYTVSFFYVTLGLFFMFQNIREQRDHDFSALLPIRKRDIVKCTVLFCTLVEIASIVVAAGFALLSHALSPEKNNLAGIDANPALLGLAFVLFAAFNLIFLPSFYRTGYKTGVAFLKACIAIFLIVAVDVVLPHVFPQTDGYNKEQYLMLMAGAAIYSLLTWISYLRCATLFEKVDL